MLRETPLRVSSSMMLHWQWPLSNRQTSVELFGWLRPRRWANRDAPTGASIGAAVPNGQHPSTAEVKLLLIALNVARTAPYGQSQTRYHSHAIYGHADARLLLLLLLLAVFCLNSCGHHTLSQVHEEFPIPH